MQGKKDAVKEVLKRFNTRVEKILTAQAPWAMPNDVLRERVMSSIKGSVLSRYRDFYSTAEAGNFTKTQKHLRRVAVSSLQRCC